MTAPPEVAARRPAGVTLLGVAAILFWGTTIACSRSVVGQLGQFTSGAAIYLLAGAIGCGGLAARGRLVQVVRGAPRAYLVGCGALMVGYTVLLYTAIGLARTDQQVVEVTVANYLWPGLTLLFSVPLLGRRAWLPGLLAGMALCLAGVALASGAGLSLRHLSLPGAGGWAAAAAVVLWGLYSNLSRRWGAKAESSAMPLFLLASGICLLLLRLAFPEPSSWTPRALGEVTYLALFPALLGYVCWDIAMRRGNVTLLAALSYGTPLLSVAVSALYLGIHLQAAHWVAAGLVIVGAVFCRLSVSDGGGVD